jgi:hypothetical protein
MKKDMEIPRRKKAITFGVTSKILLTTIGYRGNYYRDKFASIGRKFSFNKDNIFLLARYKNIFQSFQSWLDIETRLFFIRNTMIILPIILMN